MVFKTEQEEFWATDFGNEYQDRNVGEKVIVSKMVMFSKVLRAAPGVKSIVELGCNIGLNLQALKRINADFELSAYEINERAAQKARDLGIADVTTGTILDPLQHQKTFDVAFTAGVLIHINPDQLDKVYQNLYGLSHRYILVSEYYNPTPVTVTYRGHENRLYKRDFAGELIDKFGLTLIDYGFTYHRDPYFPRDDATWFLLSK
jgi:pseudaminic acid biosynthesis-associated methylase